LAWAATAVAANAAFLVFKSRAKQGLALLAAICTSWQPAYFLLTSIERIAFLVAMVAGDVKDESAGSCGFSSDLQVQILATQMLMPVSLLLFSLSAICCDYDTISPPPCDGARIVHLPRVLLQTEYAQFWASARRMTGAPFLLAHSDSFSPIR